MWLCGGRMRIECSVRGVVVLVLVLGVGASPTARASPFINFFDMFVPGVRQVFVGDPATTPAPMVFLDAPAADVADEAPPTHAPIMFFPGEDQPKLGEDEPRRDDEEHTEANPQDQPQQDSLAAIMFFPVEDPAEDPAQDPTLAPTQAPTQASNQASTQAPTQAPAKPSTSTPEAAATGAQEETFHYPSDISANHEVDGGHRPMGGPLGGPGLPPRRTSRPGPCPLEEGRTMHRGSCERLLTNANCEADEWLVLRDEQPVCEVRPCPWGQVPFQGRCVVPTDLSGCDEGQIIYMDFSGETFCECEHDHLYDSWSGNCYARHDKGSCGWGEYLDVTAEGRVVCVHNPCLMEGLVQDPITRRCFRKQYPGYCSAVQFHAGNRTAECLDIAGHNIFDVATLRECPEGSLRDFLGECRKTFHVPTLNSFPILNGGCPGGFIRDPAGVCRKTSRLFG